MLIRSAINKILFHAYTRELYLEKYKSLQKQRKLTENCFQQLQASTDVSKNNSACYKDNYKRASLVVGFFFNPSTWVSAQVILSHFIIEQDESCKG